MISEMKYLKGCRLCFQSKALSGEYVQSQERVGLFSSKIASQLVGT